MKNQKSREEKNVIFTEIPEWIVSKKMSRKDYEENIKILQKVRTLYIAEKLKFKNEKPDFENIALTDEDYVPVGMFDRILHNI